MRAAALLLLAIAAFTSSPRLTGKWQADLAASSLPAGFPQLRSQTMEVEQFPGRLRCVTERVTVAGVRTRSEFTSAFDGKRNPVTGIPEITAVSLHQYPGFIEADFFHDQKPVFSYHLWVEKANNRLIVISVDPVTKKKLHARIVYHRM